MNCDCCGKRKGILESFALLQKDKEPINLCVKCNDLAYKVRDAANEGNKDDFERYLNQWKEREKKPTEVFLKWKKKFVENLSKEVE